MSVRSTTTSDEKELQDFIDGLIGDGDSWKTLLIASYKLAIKSGASHEEAMQKAYKAILKVAIEVLPKGIE